MALITNYSSLQTEIANWLARDNMDADVPTLIQMGERQLRDDERARLMTVVNPFSVSTDETSIPGEYDSLESIDHVGPTFFGPVENVPLDQLGEAFARFGETGPPSFAAILNDASGARIRWAPVPDDTYDLSLVYWIKPSILSDSNQTNRLLTLRPDIYLYASLVQSAPFLKDDQRIGVWQGLLEQGLNALEASQQRAQFSGTLNRRPGRRF